MFCAYFQNLVRDKTISTFLYSIKHVIKKRRDFEYRYFHWPLNYLFPIKKYYLLLLCPRSELPQVGISMYIDFR